MSAKKTESPTIDEEKIEKKLTMLNAIRAKCHDCMGYYTDGKTDCENFECPLYNWMPYAEYEPLTPWLKYNPKRVGRVTWAESQRPMTEEQRKELSDRMRAIAAKQREDKK